MIHRISLAVILIAPMSTPSLALDLSLRSDFGKKSQFEHYNSTPSSNQRYRNDNTTYDNDAGAPRIDRDALSRKHMKQARKFYASGDYKNAYYAAYNAMQAKWEDGKSHELWALAADKYFRELERLDAMKGSSWWKFTNWRVDTMYQIEFALQFDPSLTHLTLLYNRLKAEHEATDLERRESIFRQQSPKKYAAYRAYNSGMDAFRADDYLDAAKQFRLYTNTYPEDNDGFAKLAFALLKLNRHKESIEAYKTLARLEPDNVDIPIRLGWLFSRTKQYREAVKWVERATQIDNTSTQAFYLLGKYKCNRFHATVLDFDGAVIALSRAVELSPDHANANGYLGNLLYELGRHEAAESILERAIELESGVPHLHSNLSSIQWKREKETFAKQHNAKRGPSLSQIKTELSSITNAAAPTRYRSLKTIEIPSPHGYKSESERRKKLASLSDAHIERELYRTRETLLRMQHDFAINNESMEKWIEISREAEREALMICFNLLLGSSMERFEEHWDKYPIAKKIAERGLGYLSNEGVAEKMSKSLEDKEARLDSARFVLGELHSKLQEIDPKRFSKTGGHITALAGFFVDYGYQAARWSVAREQVRIIESNIGKKNGANAAVEALGRLTQDFKNEQKRRSHNSKRVPPSLRLKGLD